MKSTNPENYIMTFDYHTHTFYSGPKHCASTIEENVIAAAEKGLKGIAITDHGPGHLLYGLDPSKLEEMHKEVERLQQLYPDMEILLGVEANITGSDKYKTAIDVPPYMQDSYDFIIAGYHYGIPGGHTVSNWMNYNLLRAHSMGKKALRKANTDMVLKALYENDIKILTHPGDKGPFDMDAIAKACEETDTWMEISAWHSHMTVDELKIASKYDVRFVISSDAHTPDRIGKPGTALLRAIDAGLDLSRILNIRGREI